MNEVRVIVEVRMKTRLRTINKKTTISVRQTTIIVSGQEYDINFYWFIKHDLLSDKMYRLHQRWQQLCIIYSIDYCIIVPAAMTHLDFYINITT